MIDATHFTYSQEFYENEFKDILRGITSCYRIMIKNNTSLPNDENEIRNILRKDYLNNRKIRDRIKFTGKYNFDREVPEDNDIGRVDIKVTTLDTLKEPEAYYIIECKRLNNVNISGTTGLNAEYIKSGILRFVERKYSAYYQINGMIGFVVEHMDIGKNINNINILLNKNFKETNTERILVFINFIKNFKYSYFSVHKDIKEKEIKLYHLMFDFSKNIENSN